MFYLTYVMFLLAGHSGLSAATGANSCGAAWPGTTLNFCTAHGRRGGGSHGVGGSCRGGGSHGTGGPLGGERV
jgi:hypothetical protein